MTGVLVAATQVPFERGGAEWHAEELLRQLRRRGLTADMVRLPFQWDPREEILRACMAWRLLDFSRAGAVTVERLIALGVPYIMIRRALVQSANSSPYFPEVKPEDYPGLDHQRLADLTAALTAVLIDGLLP